MACEHKFIIIEVLQDKFKKGFFKPKLGARIYVMQCEACGVLVKETIMISGSTEVIYDLSAINQIVEKGVKDDNKKNTNIQP